MYDLGFVVVVYCDWYEGECVCILVGVVGVLLFGIIVVGLWCVDCYFELVVEIV